MSDPRDQTEAHRHAPYDIDVEQAVIGTMIRHNAQIDVACADITSEFFYDPLHARLFDMLVALRADGDAITPLILHATVKSDPGVIETGGQAYFDALFAAAPAIPNMRDWGNILMDLAHRRSLIKIGQDLVNGAYDAPSETTGQKIADVATEALLQAGRATSKPILSLREIAHASIQKAQDLRAGKTVPMVKIGLDKVDRETGGFGGAELIIVLGKSGMGKSALMCGVSRFVPMMGTPTIVFSLEMTAEQWVNRMITDHDFDANEKAMWYSRIRNGKVTDDEVSRFVLAADSTDNWPFEIHEDADMTVAQISARARAFAAKHGKHADGSPRKILVMVDYLQIIQPVDERENRERQVARIARGLKALAKKLDCPVIAGSQANEGDTQRSREERRPQGSDARESRAIFNEADWMFAPYRPAYFVEHRKPMDATPGDVAWNSWAADLRDVRHRLDLLCLKARHGRTFDVELYCDMGANAIRDEPPMHTRSPHEQAAADLLTNV